MVGVSCLFELGKHRRGGGVKVKVANMTGDDVGCGGGGKGGGGGGGGDKKRKKGCKADGSTRAAACRGGVAADVSS